MSSAAFLVACHMCTYSNKIMIYCMQLLMLANKIWLIDWLIDKDKMQLTLWDLEILFTIMLKQ